MNAEVLTVRREGPVEYLTLNRPEVRNAFNVELIAALTHWADEVRDAAERDGLRVAVLAGAGRVFCAGADLKWMSETIDDSKEENLRDATAMAQMFQSLNSVPLPLVGRLHGAALGGGCGLAAVCDVVVSERPCVFGFTEVKLGILPSAIAPFVLAKIGRSAARELFLTGARFSAERAREIGLVHSVVASDELDQTVGKYIREILTAAPGGIAAAKALIPELWHRSIDEAVPLSAEAIARRRVTPEAQEGMRAFLEKRTPSWAANNEDDG
jgi:methylglutaconyl-CoA hydratase